MVVRSERAEFYKSAQHFTIGSIPLKILGLKDSQASQKQGGTDAGKWVFSLEETASARCHVLAVGSEQLREKWLQVLAAAADPKQAAAFMQGLQEQPVEEHDTTPAAHPLAHAPRSITMDTDPKPHDIQESNEDAGQASAVPTGIIGDEINGSTQCASGEANTVREDAEDDERATTDTLAKFAQRWKLEAEKMTCLAQSSMSAQAETAKEKEALEAELSKMRAQVARARFLEDDSQKTFKEKVAQCQQEAQSLKVQLSAQRSEQQKDAEAMERLIAEKDLQLQDKDKALETMSAEILQLNLQLDVSTSQVAFDGVEPHLMSGTVRDQSH